MFLFVPFSNSLLIIFGVNQMPVSKLMFTNLITILSSMCFHYCCAASQILTSTVPGVGLALDKNESDHNDLVLLVFNPLSLGAQVPGHFEVI